MTRRWLWAIALLALWGPLASQGAVHKCVIKGAVHYQQAPCPQAEPRREPTLAELNEAQKRLPPPARPTARAQPHVAPDAAPASPGAPIQADLPVGKLGAAGYRCDGRKRCSQMTSCSEARFFLANCPTVEMDGDADGIPCERQWCQP
jgi:hypothetical protein